MSTSRKKMASETAEDLSLAAMVLSGIALVCSVVALLYTLLVRLP